MRLAARVRRMEARAGRAVACGLCGGKKWISVVMGEDGEPRPPCPRCGNPPTVIRLVRGEPPPGWADRWADLGDPP